MAIGREQIPVAESFDERLGKQVVAIPVMRKTIRRPLHRFERHTGQGNLADG